MKSPFASIGHDFNKIFNKGTIGGILGGIKQGARVLGDPLVGAGLSAALGPEIGIPVMAGANLVSHSSML
jgi:hypothetical protein